MISGLEVAFSLIGEFRPGCKYGAGPVQQVLHAQVEAVHVVPPRLINREADSSDVVEVSEGVQRSERITFELAVPAAVFAGSTDQDAGSVFQVDDL